MRSLVCHDEEDYREGRRLEEEQGQGTQRFELSRSAAFLPLEMVGRAIAQRVKDLYGAEAHGLTWHSARIEAERPIEAATPGYKSSNTNSRPVEQELTRMVSIKANGFHHFAGDFKVMAKCELYRHPKDDSGWESGKVEMTWAWALEKPETVAFLFEHYYEGGDLYTTRIKRV